MKTQLIMLENPIIISDEKINSGLGYSYEDKRLFRIDQREWQVDTVYKIIASTGLEGNGFAKIDWNGLEDQFGYVDVEKLAENFASGGRRFKRNPSNESGWIAAINGFKEGYEKAQELNDKKFSLDDIREAMNYASQITNNRLKYIQDYIDSLSQPKIFDIEVEMDYRGIGCEAYQCNHPLDPEEWTCDNDGCESDCRTLRFTPKVTEDKIKILKKL